MADQKLLKVSDIACGLFINMGYARAQIRDIAKSAGIATGAVYLLFASKKALLSFVIKRNITPGYADNGFPLPIDEDAFQGLENEVMSAFGLIMASLHSRCMDARLFTLFTFSCGKRGLM